MPAGIPVGTLAIGVPGATNAGLLAASIVARGRPAVERALAKRRQEQTRKVLSHPDPRTARRKKAPPTKSPPQKRRRR
jgi:5-(carboxyamino)imidazole ribonucleotide mutase